MTYSPSRRFFTSRLARRVTPEAIDRALVLLHPCTCHEDYRGAVIADPTCHGCAVNRDGALVLFLIEAGEA